MHYTIIKDEDKFKSYIEILPELEEDECFYVVLLSRRKYLPGQPNSTTPLARFVCSKKSMLDKVRQLECPIGSHKVKGVEVVQEALALYLMPNPRSKIKATFNLIVDLTTALRDKHTGLNPLSYVDNSLNRAKSRSVYTILDIDLPINENELTELSKIIGNYDCIKTNGGYHILIQPLKAFEHGGKKWHVNMEEFLKDNAITYDQKGDLLSPIPGCVQGQHIPTIMHIG